VARAIHDLGGRSGNFVAVNCGSLSDGVVHSELFGHAKGAFSGAGAQRAGLVESARGGTLFLDEIGDASPSLQASLLRLLEQREFRRVGSDEVVASDARIVAATHASLADEVAGGRFRQDLFGRLEQWVITVPPLRERPEDVAALAVHFARAAAGREMKLSRSLMVALLRARWPQNVRQLRAVVAQAVVECDGADELRLSDAMSKRLSSVHDAHEGAPVSPPEVRPQRPSARDLRDQLVALNCNISAVSQALGVSRNSLYRWIEEAGIDLDALREENRG
jgi:DNA-binding NtrC family response regulator